MRTVLSVVALITFTFIISTATYADTFTVTNLNDSGPGSLRQAIIDANTNMNGPGVVDEIVFQDGLMGTIPTDAPVDNVYTGQMTITDDVTITGPGAGIITIDAQMIERIFTIDDGDSMNDIVVSINGLTFINGIVMGDGGAMVNREQLSIDSCVFQNNSANDGGAIWNNGTIEEISNSTFSGNSAAQNGGAIFNTVTIQAITNSTLSGNTADNEGGAIFNTAAGTIEEINNSTFSGNMASIGGAITNEGAIQELTGSIFSENDALIAGGAIRNAVGSIITEITNTTFTGNSTDGSGGAIWNNDTIEQINNSTFSGNSAAQNGGAILNASDGTIVQIINSTFTGNTAIAGDGGAISNAETIGTISNSTFNSNSADNNGGAIWNSDTIGQIINSTFTGNSSTNSDGGAIWNNANINISFTTIAFNEASSVGGDGGGLNDNSSMSIHIRNSIVAFNLAGDQGNNCFGNVEDESNNYSNDSSCDFGDGDDANIILDPLADNGGPTETIALLGGDPLDGASADCDPLDSDGMPTMVPLPYDQRYFTRPFGPACDSGSYENGPSASVRIKKVTDPPGGTGYNFMTMGFDDLQSCPFQGDSGELVLNHNDAPSCAVPFGNYSITEDIPEDQVLNIYCTEDLPPGSTTDNDTGELSFSIVSSEFNVNCLFINVTAETVLSVTEEPEGENCAEGGVKIETGLDTNLNGVLDPEEVLNTYYVCNGETGATGPQEPEGPEGPQGPPGPPGPGADVNVTEEPPGANCEFGGVKVEVGTDTNGNDHLDPDEVEETFYVCNGAPGSDDNSSCSLVAANSISKPSGFTGLLVYLLIPAVIVVRRKFWRR